MEPKLVIEVGIILEFELAIRKELIMEAGNQIVEEEPIRSWFRLIEFINLLISFALKKKFDF